MRPTSIQPTSDPACRLPRAERGFTLVELMVVIAIIALVTSVAIVATGDPRGDAGAEAERLAGRIGGARDRAIIDRRPIAVAISPTGYSFAARMEDGWQAWPDRAFAPVRWREGTVAMTPGSGPARIWFDTTGMPSAPLAVRLLRAGSRASVTVDLTGRVRIGD